ncbi:MAG: hypothetical protein KatS3mg031_1173 [Chitinophagales bacterium]|nr:MAG: hypothetical protein KatS3mg031_1173 [Chitinophagales bacterium]
MDLEKSIFLTFDIDWACDEVIRDTLDILEEHQVRATFFVTHSSSLLNSLVEHPLIEIGLHPNFNNLLNGQGNQSVQTLLEELQRAFPAAVSIRTHSLMQSSVIFNVFARAGMKYDLNMFIPFWSNIICYPYKEINGMIRVPYMWEDDVHTIALQNGLDTDWSVHKYLTRPGIKVFDYHPIHVFLNTETLERYNQSREFHKDPLRLLEFRNNGKQGVRTFLTDLIAQARNSGFTFCQISDLKY